MLRRLWKVCLLLCLTLPVFGQATLPVVLQQRKVDVSDGLDAQQLQDLYVDSLGYYWFCDIRSLFRFDGREVIKFDHRGLEVPGNAFLQYFQTADGLIWFGVQALRAWKDVSIKGRYTELKVFDPYTQKVLPAEEVSKALPCPVNEIFRFSDDGEHLFLFTTDSKIYHYRNGKFHFLYHEDCADALLSATWSEELQQYYWASSNDLYMWDGEGKSQFCLQLDFKAFNLTAFDDLLIAHIQKNRDVFPSSVQVLQLARDDVPRSVKSFEQTVLVGHGTRDSIWVADESGFSLYAQCSGVAGSDLCQALYIPSNNFQTNLRFVSGSKVHQQEFWFLTAHFAQVVALLNKGVETIPGGEGYSVRDILQVDSVFLLTTYNGAQRYNLQTRQLSATLPEIGIGGYALHDAGEQLYIGRHAYSYLVADRTTWLRENKLSGTSYRNFSGSALLVLPDSSGQVWVGTQSGLRFYSPEEQTVHEFYSEAAAGLSEAHITQIVPCDEGFWISSSDGVYLLHPELGLILDSFSLGTERIFESVYPLTADSVWLVPREGNPILWERSVERLTELDIFRPKLGNDIHTIIRDKVGAYWLPSNNGLYRYDPQTGRVLQLTKESHGIPDNEFNRLSWEVLDDGRLAFGGVNGMCLISPEAFVTENHSVAPVYITNLSYKLRSLDSLLTPPDRNVLPEIFPADLAQLSIGLAQLSPFQEGVRYFYRLDNSDEDAAWEEIAGDRLNLERLRPGAHLLELTVKGEFDQTLSATTSWSFFVRRPWYQQWWFYVLLLAVAYGLFRIYLRYQLSVADDKRRVLEALVLERTSELEQERSLIAQQNDQLQRLNQAKDRLYALITHEIKGPLLGVLGMSKKIDFLLQHNRKEDIVGLSRKIDQNARQVSLLLDNMISWGQAHFDEQYELVTEQIPLLALLKAIILELDELAQPKQLEFCVQVDEDAIIAFEPHALRVVLRNVLHNAVKFSEPGSTVEVRCETLEQQVSGVTVTSMGTSFPADLEERLRAQQPINPTLGTAQEQGSGLGLRLCLVLARRNHATLQFSSPPNNEQTSVELRLM
ncbi:MAG: ATP-binding protein [Bacteroidota bacterium]